MLIYNLVDKCEDKRIDDYLEYIYGTCNLECKLIIDGNYFIKRYTYNNLLYYVHIRDGKCFKVCCYRGNRNEY